jgi:hypothetical protein
VISERYAPVFLPVEPSWSWLVRTMRVRRGRFLEAAEVVMAESFVRG